MTTLVDGLGGEELGDTGGFGDTGSKVSAIWITGSIVTQSDIQAAGTGSFIGSLYGARLNDAKGLLESVSVESGTQTRNSTAYGGNIKVGGVTLSAESGATITFDTAFATGSYAMFFSVTNQTVTGSEIPFVSGATRASGCEVIGTASQTYNWLAVGI